MAEGFANRYGSDVLSAESAGLAPAGVVVKDTIVSMAQKNIDISRQYSKAFRVDQANDFDLIVNMSGYDLPKSVGVPVRDWQIEDPIGQSEAIYGQVRDHIETLVMNLVLEFRRASKRA
jgi:protein-tyrosine-phosphatase